MSCTLWEDFLSSFDFLAGKGDWIQHKKVKIFFGNHLFGRADLNHSKNNWFDLKQVHGDVVVPAHPVAVEADGHYSDATNTGLLIRTADCMPVFLISGERVIALHIGWRGLAKKILSKAQPFLPNKKDVALFVGPHIGQQSFALDEKNSAFLLDQHKIGFKEAIDKKIAIPSVEQKNHFLISLSAIVKREAETMGIKNINISPIDTFTSPLHFSHRRNRFHITRNHSFILRLP